MTIREVVEKWVVQNMTRTWEADTEALIKALEDEAIQNLIHGSCNCSYCKGQKDFLIRLIGEKK